MSKPGRSKIKVKLKRKKPTSPRTHYVTKKGNSVKLHSNIQSRRKAKKDARARKRAAYLATMPKSRFKRILYRLHPKRAAKYWFSREGGIMALKLSGVGILAIFLLLVGVFAFFRKDLIDLRDISGNNIGGSVRYYDRTGQTLLWEDYDAVKRTPVESEQIPQIIKDATVAIEDQNFYNHNGFDVKGITRAGLNNVLGGGDGQQGGSTITQQLVKLTQNWTKDRTYARKIKEVILAVELERSFNKDEILTGYLNTAPYGDITYGVESAMQDYFHKSANKMTIDEAAFLAAIPKSPSTFSPNGARYEKEELIGRQHFVLELLEQEGKITADQKEKAKEVNTLKKLKKREPKYSGIQAPWFVLRAKDRLIEERGAETVLLGGLKVTTSLDLEKQKIVEEEVEQGLDQVRFQGGDVASFVLEDVKTGQVVAYVGGPDFNNKEYGQNDYAKEKLPPGSSFKPYDYLSLIENTDDFGAGSVLYDTQDPLPGWPCTIKTRSSQGGNCLSNYDFRTPGPLTLRYSLGGSRNIPAVKAMLIAGVDKTIETAEKLGLGDLGWEEGSNVQGAGYNCYEPGDVTLTKEAQCFGSAAIGDGAFLKLDQHVHAYSTISRNGNLLPQTYILKIENASGKTIKEWQPSQGKQVVREDSAYIVADMMSDANASYFGSKSQNYNGHKFSMKTGTTNDSKDGWMMGFSTQYAGGTWVGYHNRQVEMSGFMERMTQPIWDGIMRRVHDPLQPEERQKPAGVQTLPAFIVRNHVGVGSVEPSPATDLYPSWYKSKTNANSSAIIDKVSKKLATDCTPERAKEKAGNAQANLFSGDTFHGATASNTSEKDDVHRCEDAKPAVNVSAPGVCDKSCTISATVRQGTHPLSSDEFPGTVNIYVDGQIIKSSGVSNSPSTVSVKYNSNISGTKTVRADVVDSVLYDSSDSQSVTFKKSSSASAPQEGPTITGASYDGGTQKLSLSWSDGVGSVTIKFKDDDSAICSSGGGACTSSGTYPATVTTREVYAIDSEGNTSTAVSITGS